MTNIGKPCGTGNLKRALASFFIFLGLSSCASQPEAGAVLSGNADIRIVDEFKFDCGTFRPPNLTLASFDGSTFLVADDCENSRDYSAVSLFDLNAGVLLRTWSLKRRNNYLKQDPTLVRVPGEMLIFTIQSKSLGADVADDSVCLDRVDVRTREVHHEPCAGELRLGNLIDADINPARSEALIIDFFQDRPRIWKFDIEGPSNPELTLAFSKSEQEKFLLEDYVVTDASFFDDDSLLVHLRGRGEYGSPETYTWRMTRLSRTASGGLKFELLSQAEKITCNAWLTGTGLIGNPWSYARMKDPCELQIQTGSQTKPIISKILSERLLRGGGIGVMHADRSDCCILVYSQIRNRIEYFTTSAGIPPVLIDCAKLVFARCGQVFLLEKPGEFLSVHGKVANKYRILLDWVVSK